MADLRRAASALFERLAEPYVTSGAATLTRSGGDDEALELAPRDPCAAAITLTPGLHYHSLNVGPEGNLHEILVGRDDA